MCAYFGQTVRTVLDNSQMEVYFKEKYKKKKPSLIEVLPLTDKDKYLCWEKDVQFKLPLQFAVMFMFFYFIYCISYVVNSSPPSALIFFFTTLTIA